MSPNVIINRVKAILERLGIPAPPDDVIGAEIDIDEEFIGEGYGIPSCESIAVIREVSQADGVFLGPVYTGKGFAGMLSHLRQGKLPFGANIVFLHTGDTVNLFETSTIVGGIAEGSPAALA